MEITGMNCAISTPCDLKFSSILKGLAPQSGDNVRYLGTGGRNGMKRKSRRSSVMIVFCVSLLMFLSMSGAPGTLAAGMGKGFPIGEMVSQGDVSVEIKENRWKRIESFQFPVFYGMKIRTGKGKAIIALTNGSQIEMNPHTALSFGQEDRLSVLQGGLVFRIPPKVQMKFMVKDVSVLSSRPLQAYKNPTGMPTRLEDTVGSLALNPNGSMTVRSSQGSLSVLDHHRNVLATLSSEDMVRIPPEKVLGKQKVMVAQVGELTREQKTAESRFTSLRIFSTVEADELEQYLIEFSKALEGKKSPPDIDAEKFFATLQKYYFNPEVIEKVKQFPMTVENDGNSYILTCCDREGKYKLYRDLGKTTDYTDDAYWPDRRAVPCKAIVVPEQAMFIWSAQAWAMTFAILLDRDKDQEDLIPICP